MIGGSIEGGNVNRQQRWTKRQPCPICSGCESDPRGQERRCIGFRSRDGEYIHCSREERAGSIKISQGSETFGHRAHGACACGVEHAPARPDDGRTWKGRPIERTYDYVDEKHVLLFQAVRLVPKDFSQRRPDGKGGWIGNLEGVRRVLYRLPELLASPPDAPVYIVEGEKDVETLRELGLVATTNPMGAKKWGAVNADARVALGGRHVVIVPDMDEDGQLHADKVQHAVAEYAASVRRIRVPAPAKDVTEWLRSGATRADLEKLVTAAGPTGASAPSAPAWTPPAPLGDHLPPVPPFVPELLPEGIRAWVTDIAHRMSVPIDLPAVAAMCMLSVVATNARTVRPKRRDPWRVFPILWGAAIAPPGSKKTPSTAQVFKLLGQLDLRSRRDFDADEKKRKYDAMLAELELKAAKEVIRRGISNTGPNGGIPEGAREAWLAAQDKQEHTEKPRRYIAQDATVEKIIDLVERGARRRSYPIAILWDELLGLLGGFDREGREGDRQFFLEGWSATTRATDRIGRGSILTRNLSLIIFGNATPEPFEEYVREACGGHGADGLLQRFQLMVYPDRIPPRIVDEFQDMEAERRAMRLVERLASIDEEDEDGLPPALNFAEDAQDFFFEWLSGLMAEVNNDDEHAAIRSHLSKYESLMPAIALICHLADESGTENRPISLWAAQQAAGWCDYLRAHALRIYSLAVSPERAIAAQIARRIESGALVGEATVRECYRRMKMVPEVAKAGLELLDELGWVRLRDVRTPGRAGRPREMVEFNPIARCA